MKKTQEFRKTIEAVKRMGSVPSFTGADAEYLLQRVEKMEEATKELVGVAQIARLILETELHNWKGLTEMNHYAWIKEIEERLRTALAKLEKGEEEENGKE